MDHGCTEWAEGRRSREPGGVLDAPLRVDLVASPDGRGRRPALLPRLGTSFARSHPVARRCHQPGAISRRDLA